jgi:peptidyl-prolyl cis-trans isomerase C
MGKDLSVMMAAMFIGLWGGMSTVTAEDLATVNDRVITSEELESKLSLLGPQAKMHYSSSAGKLEFLDNLITGEVVFQESLRMGLDKDKNVQARLEDAKRQILINTMVEKIVSEKLGEEQIKKYYEGHKKDFKQVKASHILVNQEDQAKDIYKQLKAGADFSELAKKHSVDTGTKDSGGDLGYFSRGQMVQPFEEMAFSLKVNKFGEPVKTDYGYHIIKVLDIKDAKKFEELNSADISNVKNKMLNEELEKLKKGAKIVVHKDRVK